jgi:hypothetical protein
VAFERSLSYGLRPMKHYEHSAFEREECMHLLASIGVAVLQ